MNKLLVEIKAIEVGLDPSNHAKFPNSRYFKVDNGNMSAINGWYIFVVHHGLHLCLFALADSVTVLTIVYRLTRHQTEWKQSPDWKQSPTCSRVTPAHRFAVCPSRETLVGPD